MNTIKGVLMSRDGLTAEEADIDIAECKADLHERIERGDNSSYDICEEYFGLEPDYLMELI